MSQFHFEVFRKGTKVQESKAYVTLQRKGPISLNLPAYRSLGEPPALELLFDKDEQLIGLKAADLQNANAYPVRAVGSATFQVAGRAFMKFYGINSDATRRYVGRLLDQGILGIDLKKLSEIRTSNRNGRTGTNGRKAEQSRIKYP